MRILNKRILILFTLAFLLLGNISVFAAPAKSKVTQQSIGFTREEERSKTDIDTGLPSVSSDQIAAYGERKGGEVIGILQTWGQPILIGAFILGALMTVFGFFSKSGTTRAGLGAMFFAALAYCVIMYAPEIMDAILGWARS